jgi:adenylate cyclase
MKVITHWALAFITAALLIFAHYDDSTVVQTLRLKQFDLLQQTDTPVPSQDIAILEIDEATIEKYGQWPWKRTVLADIVVKLRESGAGIIVLPMVFSEEDRLGGDMPFIETIAGNGVVIAQVGSTQVNRNAVPRGVAKIGDPLPYLFEWPGMLGPIPLLGENADGVGVVNTAPEIDGVVRRVPLIMRVGDETYPSLAVEVIRLATGAPSYQIKAGAGGVEKIRIPGYPIVSTDPNAQIWLRWNKQFSTISAASDDWSAVEGKTVIVGITADGIGGLIASPTGAQYNYIPAAVTLQTMIDGDQIQRPFWANLAEIGASAILTILLVLLARFTPYYIVGGAIVVFVGGLGYGALYAWQNYLYLMDAAMPAVAVILVGLHAVFARFVSEFFQKQQIKKQFGTYVNPTVVEQLQKDPSLIKLGGEEKILTCVMTDMRNFTGLGESYGADVQGFTSVMNEYMTAIANPVLDNDGTLIKFIGDASMHIHGAPIDNPNHAYDAVKTVKAMLKAVEDFNFKLKLEGKPPVGMGAGVNTGKILVGNIGSDRKMGYDCLGDPVSVAARLESQTKSYGVLVIVGPDTVAATKDKYDYFELDNIAVKGKELPLRIYTLHKSSKSHTTFLKNYYGGAWDTAIKQADHCMAVHPRMKEYYTKMAERMQQGKPSNWDGIYRATSK